MPTFLETLSESHLVAEQAALLRLEADKRRLHLLQRAAETTQLLESDAWASSDPYQGGGASVAGLGSNPNDLFHPGAIGAHSARPGSRRDGGMPPYYRTESDHWRIVEAARVVEAFCPAAVTVLDVLSQFAIHTGFTYSIVEKKKPGDSGTKVNAANASGQGQEDEELAAGTEVAPKSNPTVDAAQEYLDRWLKAVRWNEWETELFRRTRRDGEAFLLLEPDEATGMMGLRSIEPEQVKEPVGLLRVRDDHSFRFGVLTTREDTSKPLSYNVVSQYSDTTDQHVVYDADEVFHLKTEWVDRQAKRGISDFYVNINDFPGVKKLLRYLREGATAQAAIAWIKEHPEGMTPGAMGGTSMITRQGQRESAQYFDGPRTLDVSSGSVYTAGPLGLSGKDSALILVLQAALRNIGARWQMPEGLVSGDASNANMASALVAEAPFVRAMEARQWHYRNAFKRLIERVLESAAAEGRLPEGENLLDKVEVSVEMPPVVPRKAKEETERNAILSDHGILGNSTWSAREDLDRDEELADMEADPIQSPSIMLGMEGGEETMGEAEDDTAAEGGQSDTPKVMKPKHPKVRKASSKQEPSAKE